MEQTQVTSPKPIKEKPTIYIVGYGSIFARNFVAGFAHALGAILVYIILGGLIYYLAVTFIIPQVKKILPEQIPLINPNLQFPGSPPSTEQLEGTLEKLQQGQPPTPQQQQ